MPKSDMTVDECVDVASSHSIYKRFIVEGTRRYANLSVGGKTGWHPKSKCIARGWERDAPSCL